MIRLLVADDSPLMRRLLRELFEAEGGFEVELARDGLEVLERLAAFKPQVITLDVQMPGLDGLACLDRIMVERPTPVVMVSALTRAGAEESLRALELGAVEVVAKPSGALSLKMDRFGPQLLEAVRAASQARLPIARRLAERVRSRVRPLREAATAPAPAPSPALRRRSAARRPPSDGLVVVGCSTGGPAALDVVLSALPGDFPWPVVVAQHMPASFTGALARRLDGLTDLSVREVTGSAALRAGGVYIGRGDADLVIGARPEGLVALAAPSDAGFRWHPSVDRLMDSAMALVAPTRIVGVLMTGMGDDGAASMRRLRAGGGRTIAEAESTAVVWGMPGELVRAGGAEFVEPLDRIGLRLAQMAGAA
jgi:two-component system chemotaxis response regulator CheB